MAYSLYDMLSLIGMVATISAIMLGASVHEESRHIDRQYDQRRATMVALTKLNAEVLRMHGALQSSLRIKQAALSTRLSAADLLLTLAYDHLVEAVRPPLEELAAVLQLDPINAGSLPDRASLPSPASLVSLLNALARAIDFGDRRAGT